MYIYQTTLLLMFLFLCANPGTVSAVTNIVVGKREVIYTASQRKALGLNCWPDGNLGVIRAKQGSLYFFAANGMTPKRTHGRLNAPGQFETSNCSLKGGRAFNYKAGGPVYRDPSTGLILLFYHAEVHPGGDGKRFYSVLGLAVAEKPGATFHDCGLTVQANMTQAQADSMEKVVEMGGSPYVIKDGNFMIYYRETLADGSCLNLCVARAPVEQVLAAAAKYKPVKWQKYYKGSFSEPGLGGTSSPLEKENPPIRWMDIKWNNCLQKYVMVLSGRGDPKPDLYMIFSDDGLNWSERTHIESEPGESFYPSLIGINPAQPQELGKSFYIYYTYSVAGGWNRWSDAELARRIITLGNINR